MILTIIGFGVTAFSALMVVMALGDLISQTSDTSNGVLVGLLVFFLITCAGGCYVMIVPALRRRKKQKADLETTLLGIIREKGGKVTPLEVAAECDLDVTEAKKALDALCDSGSGQLQVTEDGSMVYVFRGFLNVSQKATSKSPLDV